MVRFYITLNIFCYVLVVTRFWMRSFVLSKCTWLVSTKIALQTSRALSINSGNWKINFYLFKSWVKRLSLIVVTSVSNLVSMRPKKHTYRHSSHEMAFAPSATFLSKSANVIVYKCLKNKLQPLIKLTKNLVKYEYILNLLVLGFEFIVKYH